MADKPKKKGHSRRNQSVSVEIENRRREVARLYMSRYRLKEIARKLGYASSTISKDLTAVRKEWKEDRLECVETAIERELNELEDMERDVVQLIASCISQVEEGGIMVNHKALQGYIDRRLKIKERRAKILGSDAPEKRDLTSGGKPLSDLTVICPVPDIDPSLAGKGVFDGRDAERVENGKT